MNRFALLLVLLATPALAQQPAPPPEMQALQGRVMQEINANLQCSAATIVLQADNAKLKAEIEALKKEANNKPSN
jgi:predicted RNA-binding Zn ribbon-like protein